jgi:hypothetical protein
MSTLAYANFASEHHRAPEPPSGIKTYIDVVAALVPAEVLSLHALILSFTTKVEGQVTTIEDADTLRWAFFGLVLLSGVLYVLGQRLTNKPWQPRDWFRVGIPPLAFVAWAMLQRVTAFDSLPSSIAGNANARTVIALFLAVVLAALAKWLADVKANVPKWLKNK